MKKIGTGVLTWLGSERRSDRYGTVWLMNEGQNSLSVTPTKNQLTGAAEKIIDEIGIGKKGELIAHVIETRNSTHIGDLFHGYEPVTPSVGEDIVLGEGLLFVEPCLGVGGVQVGVQNMYNAYGNNHWMNPMALYRAHEQTVDLYFKET